MFLITDEIARDARKPVLSITVVISMASQAELVLHRLSKAREEKEKARIRREIVKAAKWKRIASYGMRKLRAQTLVHPFEDTEVFLGYEVAPRKPAEFDAHTTNALIAAFKGVKIGPKTAETLVKRIRQNRY
jgi:hypothetical protein